MRMVGRSLAVGLGIGQGVFFYRRCFLGRGGRRWRLGPWFSGWLVLAWGAGGFGGAAWGQSRLVPAAPPGEPAVPPMMLMDMPGGSTALHPLRVRQLLKRGSPVAVAAEVVGMRGDVVRFQQLGRDGRAGGRATEFELALAEMGPLEAHFLEALLAMKGQVERMVLDVGREEALAAEGLTSLVYVRPGERRVAGVGGDPEGTEFRLPFLLYTPEEARGGRVRLPLVVFLHGTGGRGTDNWKVFAEDGGGADRHFLNLTRSGWQRHMPCYVMVPQSWQENNWWMVLGDRPFHRPAVMVGQAIDQLAGQMGLPIDMARLYVTGFSGGAAGCYEMMRWLPNKFAAFVPVANANVLAAYMMPDTARPMFQVLNERDRSIRWREVRWENELWRRWGVEKRLMIYEGAGGHDTWSRAYGEEALRRWLAGQRLPQVTWPVDVTVQWGGMGTEDE
jgi:poly(3-hydroxybutyrate) depolymerase